VAGDVLVMPLRLSIPLPGPFSYSTRVGRRRSGSGGAGKVLYWLVIGWWFVPCWWLSVRLPVAAVRAMSGRQRSQ
jgi:hypothetical protein